MRACNHKSERRNYESEWLLLAGLVVLVLVAGCGRTTFPFATVEGSVALDGRPLEKGTISFVSQENTGGSAAAEIVAGQYRAQKVPRGKVLVYLHATHSTGRMVAANTNKYAPPQPEIINIIPHKYRDGVIIEVTGDSMHRDFELQLK